MTSPSACEGMSAAGRGAGRVTWDRSTVMIKPVGPACNLACRYCYYLPVSDEVYGGRVHRMSEATLEAVFAGLLPRFGPEVTIAWQGGEPTLAGLAFFERALEMQRRYMRPGQRVTHALQTNGTLLDQAWCRFFRDNGFLIGLSLDGPPRLHDAYRRDAKGRATSAAVERGMALLKRQQVEFNILCVLNDRNVRNPDELMGYLCNRGARWLQFIPAIEWQKAKDGDTPRLARFSPSAAAYGRFLCRLFDVWFEKHRTRVSIRLFDAVLNKLVLNVMPMCILADGCHHQLTVEHDGAVFGCDHFVEPRWQLGGVTAARRAHTDVTHEGQAIGASNGTGDSEHWLDRLDTDRLGAFAARKANLPEACRSCRYLALCYGGCPKHRPHRGEEPEPTVLCAGYRRFYDHAIDRLEWLAGYLRRGIAPPPPGRAGR